MIVAGGGTGGHLFPGLAVAEALRRRGSSEVLFVGSSFGIEARVVPAAGFGLRLLPVRAVRGRGWRGPIEFALRTPAALLTAWRALGEFRPDVILGVGGYASFPIVCAAWLRRIPTVLLEVNAHPGLATRTLSRLAQAVCTSFPEAEAYLPRGVARCTGTPVRELRRERPTNASNTFTLFIFGGSQGAHRINIEAVAAVGLLRARIAGLEVIHQTGANDFETVEAAYERAGIPAEVHAFIHDMASAYARADLIVCRSGSTVAELTSLGKAAILVPYPFAADDHQRANAESLQKRGAAEMILDRELTAELLAERVLALAQDRGRLESIARKARELGRPEAAQAVLAVCDEVVQRRAHA